MTDTEPELVTRIVTCHTEDCDNADQAIELSVPADVGGYACGVCGQPITDVQNG